MGSSKSGRRGPPMGAARTLTQISEETGVPRSTVFRDFDRARDLMTVEMVFQTLPPQVQRQWLSMQVVFAAHPRHVQRRWLRNKLAAA